MDHQILRTWGTGSIGDGGCWAWSMGHRAWGSGGTWLLGQWGALWGTSNCKHHTPGTTGGHWRLQGTRHWGHWGQRATGTGLQEFQSSFYAIVLCVCLRAYACMHLDVFFCNHCKSLSRELGYSWRDNNKQIRLFSLISCLFSVCQIQQIDFTQT